MADEGPEGRAIAGRLCFNSGYLEFIEEIAGELMAYEIAGFHFDLPPFNFAGRAVVSANDAGNCSGRNMEPTCPRA